jgi:hypothetical protein
LQQGGGIAGEDPTQPVQQILQALLCRQFAGQIGGNGKKDVGGIGCGHIDMMLSKGYRNDVVIMTLSAMKASKVGGFRLGMLPAVEQSNAIYPRNQDALETQ